LNERFILYKTTKEVDASSYSKLTDNTVIIPSIISVVGTSSLSLNEMYQNHLHNTLDTVTGVDDRENVL